MHAARYGRPGVVGVLLALTLVAVHLGPGTGQQASGRPALLPRPDPAWTAPPQGPPQTWAATPDPLLSARAVAPQGWGNRARADVAGSRPSAGGGRPGRPGPDATAHEQAVPGVTGNPAAALRPTPAATGPAPPTEQTRAVTALRAQVVAELRAAGLLTAGAGRANAPPRTGRSGAGRGAGSGRPGRGNTATPTALADEDDLLAAARHLGLDVGTRMDPPDLARLLTAARAQRDPLRPAPGESPPLFATAGGVRLLLPSRHVRALGYHEAMTPLGQPLRPVAGVPARTLPSRGRPTGRRTAVDIAVDPGTPVLAPVSGRVVEVARYVLYGAYRDTRIRIVPDGDAGRLVTLLHVTGATVRPGQRVEAGHSVVARAAARFPFASQVEAVAGRLPHVHLEVRRR